MLSLSATAQMRPARDQETMATLLPYIASSAQFSEPRLENSEFISVWLFNLLWRIIVFVPLVLVVLVTLAGIKLLGPTPEVVHHTSQSICASLMDEEAF